MVLLDGGEMFSSLAIPFQALLWPLVGAGVVLIAGRFLPNWTRRLIAAAAALVVPLVLWPLRGAVAARVEISWAPLNLFRTSPALRPDALSITAGMLLAGVAVVLLLAIRGRETRQTPWHGLLLISLAGALAVTMAANLLTLTLGSALIDLALVGASLWAAGQEEGERATSLAVVVPGVASTLLLLFATLRLDAEAGHNSLLAQNLPAEILGLVGLAGALRLMLYPLHPRGQVTAQDAAGLLLPVGAGIYLLARVQAIAPVLSNRTGLVALGAIAFLAGGLLVWSGSLMAAPREKPEGVGFWPGVLIVQVAAAFLYRLLLGGAVLWPLVCLPLALGALIVWWDAAGEVADGARPRWMAWLAVQARRLQADLQAWLVARLPALERLGSIRLQRLAMAWLPAIALASFLGAPFTAGAGLRWTVYASLLRQGDVSFLAILAGDTLLTAGLLVTLRTIVLRARGRRFRLASSLGLVALAVPILILGIAPGRLGLVAPRGPDVSVWGLGLLYLLPWLLGGWLALLSSRLERYARPVYLAVDLSWLYNLLGWAGRRLEALVYWLGLVGEGDGWWGWALIILALGTIFLMVR
jgi:hypothetical protein